MCPYQRNTMDEYFLDLPKLCAKHVAEGNVLALISDNTGVKIQLKQQRLHVRSKDVSTAVAVACKIILTIPNLETKLNGTGREHACDWALMHTYLTRMHGAPIATSSALNEADVVHAFRVYAAKQNTRDLASREYGLWSWSWIARKQLSTR